MAGLAAIAAGAALPAQAPGGSTCCRELLSLYEASIFRIDAMRLKVQVDSTTGAEIATLIGGKSRSPRLESEAARRYQAAEAASIEMVFLVGVSGETFVSNMTKAIRGLGRDGTLTGSEASTAVAEAAERFGFLRDKKVRAGDVLRYEVRADTLTTRYWRGDSVLAVRRETGPLIRTVILATYFAPSSDFRKGLLDDLFRAR